MLESYLRIEPTFFTMHWSVLFIPFDMLLLHTEFEKCAVDRFVDKFIHGSIAYHYG
jgi:hypothetical protein